MRPLFSAVLWPRKKNSLAIHKWGVPHTSSHAATVSHPLTLSVCARVHPSVHLQVSMCLLSLLCTTCVWARIPSILSTLSHSSFFFSCEPVSLTKHTHQIPLSLSLCVCVCVQLFVCANVHMCLCVVCASVRFMQVCAHVYMNTNTHNRGFLSFFWGGG